MGANFSWMRRLSSSWGTPAPFAAKALLSSIHLSTSACAASSSATSCWYSFSTGSLAAGAAAPLVWWGRFETAAGGLAARAAPKIAINKLFTTEANMWQAGDQVRSQGKNAIQQGFSTIFLPSARSPYFARTDLWGTPAQQQ